MKSRFDSMFALALGALVLGACLPASSPPGSSSPALDGADAGAKPDVSAAAAATTNAPPVAAVAFASSLDARGLPSFSWAAGAQLAYPGATPEGAARYFLARLARSLRPSLPGSAAGLAVARLALLQVADFGAGGFVVRLQQREGNVPVLRSEVRVLLRADLSLVAISGAPPTGDPIAIQRRPVAITPAAALATALSDRFNASSAAHITDGDLLELPRLSATLPDVHRFDARPSAPLRFPEPAQVRLVYRATPRDASAATSEQGSRLAPAWFIEFYAGPSESTDAQAYRYLVSGDDGRVLSRTNLTADDSFNDRVWADSGGDKRPHAGPQKIYTPHPTGTPDGTDPPFIAPSLVSIEGFNWNGVKPDPWLPNGAAQSLGNNVDAYVDRNAPDGFSNGDFRATTTAAGVFDRSYDFTLSPTAVDAQAMSGIMNMFYVTNWLHDWYYDSGFNEAAGNGQSDNFGRGGVSGDPMHAEAQDNLYGGSRNNANMTTPSDGFPPRMQVYVWNGAEARSVTVSPSPGPYGSGGAAFGPATFNASGVLTLVNDNVGTTSDGCEAFVNNVAGAVALADRGNCTDKLKATNAQAAGAKGIILIDSVVLPAPPTLADGAPGGNLTIPVMSVTSVAGAAIKAALLAGATTAQLLRIGPVDRDGTLDGSVVAHEWGHYLHHRLCDCGLQQCAGMSEGWADFNALLMILRDGDNLDGTYAVGTYSARFLGDSGYYGIRRQPYSVDMSKNGLLFHNISDGAAYPNTPHQGGGPNSEVHNTGEIWATMLWEVYVALMKDGASRMVKLSYSDVHRRMSDYIVAGLQLTPADATFTEQRDAILAAAAARSIDDMNVMALAFARRGIGTCAVSPPRESGTNAGVVEAFDLKPHIAFVSVALDDSIRHCDSDGVLDADEIGKLTIVVHNGGPIATKAGSLALRTPTAGITFPAGAMVPVPPIAPYASSTLTLSAALDKKIAAMGPFELDGTLTEATSCEMSVMDTHTFRVNYDDLPAMSATDDVESAHPVWTPRGNLANSIWYRGETAPISHAWRGLDFGSISDTSLESPDLVVGKAGFSVAFDHRYTFEADTENNVRVYYDGAVIELSSDGGATWQDVSALTNLVYPGTIGNTSDNPLQNRKGFVDQSKAWPNTEKLVLDFGNGFNGKTVRLRFHIGSDDASSAFGWEIDNIAFTGITNLPFPVLVDNRGKCGPEIVADAGQDQMVPAGAVVVIDASNSSSRTKKPLSFAWSQTAGPMVNLLRPMSAIAALGAPSDQMPSRLTFKVTVSDGAASAAASVNIDVAAAPPPPDMALPVDFTIPDDLTLSPDLTLPPDLAIPPDLSISPDQSVAPDLAMTPDMSPPPAASHGCGCTIGQRPSTSSPLVGGIGILMLAGWIRRRRR